jgi:hypothetical protein
MCVFGKMSLGAYIIVYIQIIPFQNLYKANIIPLGLSVKVIVTLTSETRLKRDFFSVHCFVLLKKISRIGVLPKVKPVGVLNTIINRIK